MTLTVIEYTGEVEYSRVEVPNLVSVGLFIKQRVEDLNLTLADDKTYQTPDGQVVKFTLSHESGSEVLREAITTKEVA